ncbi:MPHOSPH9 [Mytilus edulis]|uniref:MPHOSPH9 n=1 Tax=Mytilus edulis TaxID=6550 RepID=A0A8S3TQR4_MYTED|nr:MPHOSPH9 [Mytilus edulis]
MTMTLKSKDSRNGVEDTLNRIRSGKYVTRPEWEDLYTSMAKPSDNQPVQQMPREEKIRDRLSNITDLEHRYDDLSAEKRTLGKSPPRTTTAGWDPTNADDVFLSASTRVSLREKHAKHMADLREYYEKELRELRGSLLTDMTEQTPYKRVSSENQNLVIENRLLREKIQDMENGSTVITRQCRELEQINHGLEIRAKEYAENLNESQAKLNNFRNKMEELQFYYREKDESAQQLEFQVKHLNDKIRAAKKVSSVELKMLICLSLY